MEPSPPGRWSPIRRRTSLTRIDRGRHFFRLRAEREGSQTHATRPGTSSRLTAPQKRRLAKAKVADSTPWLSGVPKDRNNDRYNALVDHRELLLDAERLPPRLLPRLARPLRRT